MSGRYGLGDFTTGQPSGPAERTGAAVAYRRSIAPQTTRRGFLQAAGLSAVALAARDVTLARPHEDGPDVVVIVFDTLRSDHVFGDRARTPNMDALAREGLSFTRVYPGAMATVPARNTILSGRRQFPFRDWHDHEDLTGSPGW